MRQNRPLRAAGVIPVPPNPNNSLGGQTPTGPAASGAPIAFGPAIIPFSAPAFQNPFQGLVNWDEVCSDEGNQQTGSFNLWNGYAPNYAPVPETGTVQPLINLYGRDQIGCYWRYLEPTMGNYQLDWLDRRAAAAHAIGGQFGFRIMCMDAWGGGNSYGGNVMPDYIMGDSSYGGTNGTGSSYHPNFNNNNFLTRLEALWAAIGARFGSDPRFGLMDIGMYGNFGEWHIYGHGDITPITYASGKRIIDAHVNNMSAPNVQWVHLGDTTLDPTISEYAMGLRPNGRAIGLRGDSFGADHWYDTFDRNSYWGPADAANRWKIAPIFGEPANFTTSGTWQDNNGQPWTQGLAQVFASHVSMVGNGNSTSFSGFNATEQKAWIDCGKHSGYRIQLNNLTIPRQIEAGSHATITTTWQNVGVAPPYRSWTPVYLLKNGAGQIAWTGTSTDRDFKGMLPASSVNNENFNFPASLPSGTMALSVKVVDPTGYFQPLALANTGRTADGAYPLGTIVTA